MAERMWQRFPFQAAPYLFAIFFFLFSYEINNFNLTIDDERHAFFTQEFVALGRWLFPIVQLVWPQLVVPQATYLIFGILISITYCLALGLVGDRELKPFHFVCFAAFVAFPAVPAQLEYAAHIIPIGLSFLCTMLAVVLTLDAPAHAGSQRWLRLLAAVLLCTVAAGAYQSAILIYPVVLAPVVAYRTFLRDDRRYADAIKLYLTGLAIVVVATALYSAIAWLFLAVSGITPASDYLNKAYMASGTSALDHLIARLVEFPRGMYLALYGWWWDFGIARYSFVLAISFSAWLIVRAAGTWLAAIATAAILAAILLIPGALILVSGTEMPLRTFVAAPAALMIIFLLAYRVSSNQFVRNALTTLLVLFVIQCMYINSTQQAQAWVTQRHDLVLAGALNHDIMSLVEVREGEKVTLDFHGFQESHNVFPRAPTVLLGKSFVEWTRNHHGRLVFYLNLTGFYWYEATTDEEHVRLKPLYSDMPVWPRPGSIRIVDGVTLVKLGSCDPATGKC